MTNLLKQDVVPSHESYRLIPLTQGQVAIVDEVDFEVLNKFCWYAQWSYYSSTFYAKRRGENNSRIRMHDVILKPQRGKITDHWNGNGLDNRRDNLREATTRQNAINRAVRSDNTSGVPGVDRRSEGWSARISPRKGFRVRLGTFPTYEEAVAARRAAEKRFYREYAPLSRREGPVAIKPLLPRGEKRKPGPKPVEGHRTRPAPSRKT